jgi:glycosyltransferase involved in cell wall biosynthesis
VIIPVYKVEQYLDECVASVVNQTYRNLEIILVDDGSPDACPAMCDAWAEKDSRIRVIHKENGGLSTARNAGIEACSGEYILFIDSDDCYENDGVIAAVAGSLKPGTDVVCFNYKRYFEQSGTYSATLCSGQSGGSVLETVCRNDYTSSACLKLVNKALLFDNGITFEPGVCSEDIEFSGKLLLLAKDIAYCPEAVYVYRHRSNSITTTIKEKNVRDITATLERMAAENTTCEAYWSYAAFQYCTLLINMHFAPIDNELRRRIFSLKHLLKYDGIFQVRLIRLASRFLGTAITSQLLYMYFRVTRG